MEVFDLTAYETKEVLDPKQVSNWEMTREIRRCATAHAFNPVLGKFRMFQVTAVEIY